MMPIIFGDVQTIPEELHSYNEIINKCNFEKGSIAYLSIHESFVKEGETQRRPGVHTEATSRLGWGGGNWGGTHKGLYMASTDGRCRIWNTLCWSDDLHGAINAPDAPNEIMEESVLYWLTDRTPHEALPSLRSGWRQWFRLVSNEIGGWWRMHSTLNPLGVLPTCPIIEGSKFS